jgi:hypothetical protein
MFFSEVLKEVGLIESIQKYIHHFFLALTTTSLITNGLIRR